ncbi:MAG: rhodanese-like domain-containing protein [Rhodocyclales bacterium]|nr:rhodanese-like domain-containing protein [Rhodocyclales bacterium]
MKKFAVLLCWTLLAAGIQATTAQSAESAANLIEPGRTKGSVSIPSFNRLLVEKPEAVHLIDVSSAREFAAGSIKGATNIPINQLEKQLASLPSDKPIVFFCATGGRASEAYDTVKMLKPELVVHFLDAQVQIRPDGSPNIR